MADAVKAQKLAAARRRLKEYQQNQSNKKLFKKDEAENVESSGKNLALSPEVLTPIDSMASSTHSAFDNSATQENCFSNLELDIKLTEQQPVNVIQSNDTSASFFNNSLFVQHPGDNNHALGNYFDIMSQNSNTKDKFDAFKQYSDTVQNDFTSTTHIVDKNECNYPLPSEHNTNNQNLEYADPCEYMEQKSKNIVDENITNDAISSKHTTLSSHVPELYHKTNTNVYSEITLSDRNKSECALEDNLNEDTIENQNLCSNTESLRQLSSQLNSLIDSDNVQNTRETSELERRNQELAGLLHNEHMKTEQLNLQLREYMTRITQLESESQHMRNDHEAKLSLEIGPLQEQLQYHVQTVGILVGEKTELTMALNQSQVTAKQKTSECEELHGRLKASRHRVSELEKEVNHLKSFKDNSDKYDQENTREFERLRLECNLLKEQFQEAYEESSELREKLKATVSECASLHDVIQDMRSQLSLSQLKLQQLTSGENVQIESQLEILNQQKISLEHQIAELAQTVKVVSQERDQASQQYQQYVQQLNGQVQNLAGSLEAKNSENDTLASREQSLVKHIGELEKHLQQLQNERQNHVPVRNDFSLEIKRLEEIVNGLQSEKMELESKYQDENNRRQLMENEMLEKTEMIAELEGRIERLKDQPDASKLLAAMESDKVAASRAVEQNQKLKEQLEELHDGFIKMSNSKLELTEKLQTEQHLCKELSDKFTQANSAVDHLHSVIAIKDKELTELHNQLTELQKQILHQNQLSDRLRHYEAQGNASDFVQQEFQQAKYIVQKLTSENEDLKSQIEKLTKNSSESKIKNECAELPIQSEKVEIQMSENNETVDLWKEKIEKVEKVNSSLQEKIKELIKTNEECTSEVDGELKSAVYLHKGNAMDQLEEQFKKTMIDVANLTEEKQRLEHLVLQLQSETETIGEYVALYQCQRAVLKEKTLEKDEQLKRLAHDREEMTVKLEELNGLVQRLVVEKGIVSNEVLHQGLHVHDSCKIENKDNILNSEPETKKRVNGDNNNEKFGTAGKIIALLSEIKTSNLVQPSDSIQNFHPCPLCSGQLITV